MQKSYKGFLILLVATLPLFIPSIHGKLIILLGAVWLFSSPDLKTTKSESILILFWVYVAVEIVGVFYSQDKDFGFAFLETSAPLLFLPLIILSSHSVLSKELNRKALIAFVVGVAILNLASLFFISYDLWDSKNLQSNLITANNVIVSIHPAFLSMYIALCVFFIVDQYFPLRNLDRTRLGWVTFGLAVLLVFLIWLNSRAGILSFSLAAIFFIGYKWSGKTRAVGLTGLIIFLLLIFLLPFSKYRFLSTPLMVLTGNAEGFESDPSVYPLLNRIQVLKCDVELLKWPEILYGYGTGDFRDELQVCFAANGYERPLAEGMDSHSEYFAQLHRHGIIGLALFLALLIIPFRHSLKYQSPLLGAFIILFAVTALFENVFSAQKGVTFFALFCPLLWLYAKQQFDVKSKSGTSS